MISSKKERRDGKRIKISKGKVNYQQKLFYFFKRKSCQLEELSRGGARFLCPQPLGANNNITLKISIPTENFSQTLKGQVKWRSKPTGTTHKHQIGVQFNPYGLNIGENHPRVLQEIISLEQKY